MAQFDYTINYSNITVKISDGSIISGKINVVNYNRLSDYLRSTNDKFITVMSDDTDGTSKKATIINREHIIWADTWD